MKLLSGEKICDVLWAVEVSIQTVEYPDYRTLSHFLGKMDDQWWVMIGSTRIPDDLLATGDVSKYVNDNAVSFTDLIK